MTQRSYRDPIHDFIALSDPLFLKLIDTPEFQRLRRIRQLGGAYGTYHGAEHTRFGHSLGAHWIMTMVMDRLVAAGTEIDHEATMIARAAALLHDLGHGPFSHALEGCLTPGRDHESWTRRILLEETEVHRTLAQYSSSWPSMVAAVIDGTFTGPAFICDLTSGQLDVDRMDYLLRDSHYTGVTYGKFDLERIVSTLLVDEDRVVSMGKGVIAIEEYLLARYMMYWQVYLHKSVRSLEGLLTRMWTRAVDLCRSDAGSLVGESGAAARILLWEELSKPLRALLRHAAQNDTVGVGAGAEGDTTDAATANGDLPLDVFLAVDDHDIYVAAKAWRASRDAVLADLATRFLDRRLFKAVFRYLPESVEPAKLEEAAEVVKAGGFDPRYYLVVDDVKNATYHPYTPQPEPDDGSPTPKGRRRQPVLVLDERGVAREITQVSAAMRAIASGPRHAVNVFAPAEVIADVRRLFN